MDTPTLLARLKAMEPELRAAGLEALYLFGSRARGDYRDDSDVDLLFEAPDRAVSLWNRAEIMAALVDRLGIDLDIDLVDRARLVPAVGRSASRDLMRVY